MPACLPAWVEWAARLSDPSITQPPSLSHLPCRSHVIPNPLSSAQLAAQSGNQLPTLLDKHFLVPSVLDVYTKFDQSKALYVSIAEGKESRLATHSVQRSPLTLPLLPHPPISDHP